MARQGVFPIMQPRDSSGNPIRDGTITSDQTATSTDKQTYTDASGAIKNPNIIQLNNGGIPEEGQALWLDTDTAYRLTVKDSSGSTIYTMDNVLPLTTLEMNSNLDVNGKSIVSASDGDIAITPDGSGYVILDGIKWPQVDGTASQILSTDGSANLSWLSNATNVDQDTTPQLGGDLDTNSFDILFDSGKGIRDDSDNEQLLFTTTASAVNYMQIANAATTGSPTLSGQGGDSNVDLALSPKGTGGVTMSGITYPKNDGATWLITNGSAALSFRTTAGVQSDHIASQAEMETGTSTSKVITPAAFKHYPGVAKGWLDASIGLINGSYNVSSVDDEGTGQAQVNWTTAFSSTNYVVCATARSAVSTDLVAQVHAIATGAVDIHVEDSGGSDTDSFIGVVAYGDQ